MGFMVVVLPCLNVISTVDTKNIPLLSPLRSHQRAPSVPELRAREEMRPVTPLAQPVLRRPNTGTGVIASADDSIVGRRDSATCRLATPDRLVPCLHYRPLQPR